MDTATFMESLQTTLGTQLPSIIGAIALLIVGWFLAVVVRAGVRRLLSALRVNERIGETTDEKMDVEKGVAVGAFWLIILITLVGVFNTLSLELVSDPFNQLLSQVIGYLPRLLAGALLLILAWILATLLRALSAKGLAATKWDEKLAEEAGTKPMSKSVGNVLFWLTFLLFVPAILGAFDLEGLLEPVQGMIDEALAMIPNIVAAVAIGFVGWVVARVLRGLVSNLLAAVGVDRLGADVGLSSQVQISRLIGMIVFIFVFIPALIAALDALQIESISAPATEMLSMILEAVPNLLAAAVILIITWYVAKFAADIVSRLLTGLGFDTVPQRLGFSYAFKAPMTPSAIVGGLIVFFAMLFATVEAANRLGFSQVRDLVATFIEFGGDILLGGAIFIIGYWLANVAFNAIARASGKDTSGLGQIARLAILGLVIAMGLRAMGIADDIVNLAFGLTLGAVAVAFALSFGLGGREAAGKQMEHWFSRLRKGE
ncbi:MAG: mechanosensitive ion channel [Betaproteobacteria bacterium]|nr:MAG: mechanosensitive ion channel [Betaproteobacteria bacterium]